MLGLKKENGIYKFKAVAEAESLKLDLYEGGRRIRQIPFDPDRRIGNVWYLDLPEADDPLENTSYCYEADRHLFSDPNGSLYEGRRQFGALRDGTKILRTPVRENVSEPVFSEAFSAEWKKDAPLGIPYHENIIYRLHVRGFTKQRSSAVLEKNRGSFDGILEKLPYLKELGINAVELMPCYEFNEVMLPIRNGEGADGEIRPTGRINYWGFTDDALRKAPKASFAGGEADPRAAFQKLVLTLHKNGIEIIPDLYFSESVPPDYLISVLRFWRIYYHVDGIHLIGRMPLPVIARDPYLARFKIWADSWDGALTKKETTRQRRDTGVKYFADYNDGFQNDMRCVLKGDEGKLPVLMQRIRENPSDRAVIHYMANETGFTLRDSLSYDQKHNEENGEDNRDGTDYNYSWNCGEEGATNRKTVRILRRKMTRNALVLLFLSQGVPLLNAGDEFGRTKRGNNNSYCEDSRVNWLDWNLAVKNQDLLEFTKFIIQFRKKHGVFHQARELTMMDELSSGIPDLSFHGENAWRTDLENYRRQLGVMYSGAYAEDDTFLVLYNFHWEKHLFRLAHPPVGTEWAVAIDTAKETQNGYYEEGSEEKLTEREYLTEPRSIVVLRAVKDEPVRQKKRRKK